MNNYTWRIDQRIGLSWHPLTHADDYPTCGSWLPIEDFAAKTMATHQGLDVDQTYRILVWADSAVERVLRQPDLVAYWPPKTYDPTKGTILNDHSQ